MNFFSLKILLELWLSLKIKQTCLDRSVLLKSTTSCAFILFSRLLLSFIQSQFYKKVLANFTSCKDLDCYFLNNIFFRNDFLFVYLYVRIILLYLAKGIFRLFFRFPSGEPREGRRMFLFIWFIVEIEDFRWSSNLWFTIVEY